MDWFFLILSAFLFSSSFLCNKMFQRNNGSNLKSSLEYLFFSAIVICVTMPLVGKEPFKFSWFSFLIAIIYSINGLALTYSGIKAFKYANLSVYSMFMMLGSIVIPSVFGFFLFNEGITVMRIICFVFIFISLCLSINKGKSEKKAIIFYLLVFTLNGMAGVLSKIHQSYPDINVSTNNFLFMTGIIKLALSSTILLYFYLNKKEKRPTLKASCFAIGGGIIHSIGNYFNLFALISIPVMIHSVVTTSMVLVASALIGLLIKEKLTLKGTVSIGFALIATIFSVL